VNDDELARSLVKKKARKATPGDWPKFINIPRNWLHQAITYMDSGELIIRLIIEVAEIVALYVLFKSVLPESNPFALLGISAIVAHTWNWVTNGLFWVVVIQTFPGLRNPGLDKTVEYINAMAQRLKRADCISGMAIYGSVSRGAWHDRSDIDMRILRRPGFVSLCQAALLTMGERFRAFLAAQPMDLYLADDADFLASMRADEIPLLLIKRDERLDKLYPGNSEISLQMMHLQPSINRRSDA
jgi:predicted nucleotidyltransferase